MIFGPKKMTVFHEDVGEWGVHSQLYVKFDEKIIANTWIAMDLRRVISSAFDIETCQCKFTLFSGNVISICLVVQTNVPTHSMISIGE